MSEMIERVARAITASRGGQIIGPSQSVATKEFGWSPDEEPLERYVEKHWKENIHAAGFAIEAMREPTGEMLAPEAVSRMEKRPDEGVVQVNYIVVAMDIWPKMIDAALAPSS